MDTITQTTREAVEALPEFVALRKSIESLFGYMNLIAQVHGLPAGEHPVAAELYETVVGAVVAKRCRESGLAKLTQEERVALKLAQ